MTKINNIKLIIFSVLIIITLTCCGEAPLPVETQLTNPCASEDISAYIAGIDDIAKRFEGKTAIVQNPEHVVH